MWGGAGGAALCAGCLAGGRRLRSVSGHRPRQLLRSILEEEPVVRCDDSSVPLCWECSARLAQAVSFTHQVKTCYRTLHDFCAQNLNQPLVAIARPPRLRICVQHSENIAPGATDTDQHIVKTEVTDDWQWTTKEENNVKNELDIVSVISASERNSTANSFTLSDEEELKYLIDKTEPSADHKRKHPKTKRLSVEEPSKTKQLSTITAKTKVKKKKRYKIKCQMVKMTFEEMMQEREDLRTSDAFLSAVFKCEKCLVTFDDSDALEQHVKSKHSPEQGAFSCTTCACLFRTETELQCHGVRHLRRYVCCMCGSRHASKKQAAQHCCANVISSDSAYQSKKSKSLKEQTDMKVDILEDSETKNPDELVLLEESLDKESSGPRSTSSYPCDLCAKVFRWKTSLRKHAELHRIQSGEKKTPYCDACRLSFTTTSNLQKHMKTSSKHQIQLKVRNLSDLLAEHPEQPKLDQTRIEDIKSSVKNSLTKFPCPHCDKKFQWKGNLLRHIQSHKARASGELYCAPCDRKFSSIATYQQHMKISKKHVSENEFRYMCSECGKKFSNKTRLKDHVDWEHLKNYTHKCPLCQKVFKSHTSLYLHKQVVHRKDDGDHLCDHCGKPFPNRAKLRSHIIAMHTTEQPYKCKLCPASFSWHSCLSRHVKVVHHKVKTKRKRKNKEELMSAANADLV